MHLVFRLIFIKLLVWPLSRANLARLCKNMKIIFHDWSEQKVNTLARLSIFNVVANMVNILDVKKHSYRINSPMPVAQLINSGVVFSSIHMDKTDVRLMHLNRVVSRFTS